MNSTGKKYLIPVIAAVTLVVVVAVILAITLGGGGKNNPSVSTTGGGTAIVIPGRENTNAAVIQGSVTAAGLSSSEYSSINGVAILDDVLYISDETRKNITAVKNGEVIHTYSSELAVNGLFVYSEGVFSLEGGLGGKVVKLSLALEKISEVSVGHTPEDAIAIDNKLFVANRFSGTVSVIDISAMSLVKNIEIDGREPNALAISGGNLYVGCHLSVVLQQGMLANDDLVSAITGQILSQMLDFVAQQQAAQLNAQLVGQLTALRDQFEVGGHQNALTLLTEDPNILEVFQYSILKLAHFVQTPFNQIMCFLTRMLASCSQVALSAPSSIMPAPFWGGVKEVRMLVGEPARPMVSTSIRGSSFRRG